MNAPCFAPPSLAGLEEALTEPCHAPLAHQAWRAFTAQAGPVAPWDAFYLLWATLDFEAQPTLAERILASGTSSALRCALTPLLGSSARVLAVERGGPQGRQLVDVLDRTIWRSALAALAPVGSLVHVRLAGAPDRPLPAGPVAVFPPAARDVLGSWLLDHYSRGCAAGQLSTTEFYRQVGPALYRWWRAQRDASARARQVA